MNLLSPAEAAERLGCSTRTIYRAVEAGRLEVHYFGNKLIRISPEALAEAVRRGYLRGP